MENREAARALFGVASLLESQGANPYRVRAYRRAAVNFLRLPDPATNLTKEGGQLDVPWLGDRLRRKLGELVTEGHMQFHQDLLAGLPKPLRDLLAVPGIGSNNRALAQQERRALGGEERLIEDLHIHSPRSLIRHARQNHLQRLRGIGPLRESQLAQSAQHLLSPTPLPQPIQLPLQLPEAA